MRPKISAKLIIAVSSFFLPFSAFFLLMKNDFAGLSFESIVLHSMVISLTTALAFLIAYFSYQVYKKTHDLRVFIITLVFYIFGFIFFLNIISSSRWHFFNEKIFELTEHYGLFLGIFMLIGFILPTEPYDNKIFPYRKKIISGLFSFLFISFLLLVLFSDLADILNKYLDFFIILSGIILFAILAIILHLYKKNKSLLILYIISGFSLLINATIFPFFYERWNILWWYFNASILFSFIIIFFGLVKNLFSGAYPNKQTRDSGFNLVFGETPIHSKISTKIILFVLFLSIVPLLATNYFIFSSYSKGLSIADMENNLIAIVPITVLLVIMFGLYFSNKLTEHIESLTDISKRIADGDLGIRANIDSKDEIGILAENFNKTVGHLIEARNFPENIIRSMGDSLVVLSPEAKIIKVNQAALDLLGYERKELMGQEAERVIGREATQAIFMGSGLRKLLDKGFIKDIEISFKSKDGEDIPVSISGSVIKNENDDMAGIVVVAKDMRIFKEVEKAKSEFISIAAHQLRTPLSAIKWTIQMLLDGDFGKLNKEQKNALAEGNMANDRMVALISDLLNISRIEEGRFALKFSSVKLDKMINDVISSLKIKADKNNIKLIFIKTSELPAIDADADKFYIVLENLIDNAIKYTSANGEIIVEAGNTKDGIEIKIKDNGIGIPAPEQANIFSRFFRGSNAKEKQTDGSGLGLYIVKNIIEKHNGRIWFESARGQGTVFFIKLPVSHKLSL